MKPLKAIFLFSFALLLSACSSNPESLTIQKGDYLGTRGFDVIFFNNNYAEGKQGGIELIIHDDRIATNGDLRLEPSPGQWAPVPKLLRRDADKEDELLTARLVYPDSSKNAKGFNPIYYPNLNFFYDVNIEPGEGSSVIISVDLDEPLPEEWIGKVGFNLELFPEKLFGKGYYMDNTAGTFPRQPVGEMEPDAEGELQAKAMATGQKLVVAPEEKLEQITIENLQGELTLLDGRFIHNNGWFIVRSLVESGATEDAIRWKITPKIDTEWQRDPVVQVSQLGYHPAQKKTAIFEMDTLHSPSNTAELVKVKPDGTDEVVLNKNLDEWGQFLRYTYDIFDFSEVEEPGIYYVQSGDMKSHPFRIDASIYDDKTWQSTLEYFLPVQMCHMRINEKYRAWHGVCHLDDALMAPADTNHFDGYLQGPSTLTDYEDFEPVPGLNTGGWHDAGDYDLRVESQAGTVQKLAYIYEEFGLDYDQTMIDQEGRIVEIHQPDGQPDVLQQIEHGLLSILGGYDNLGRLYRGIISNKKRQYVHLGDAATMTDNEVYDGRQEGPQMDDRWVFTEDNPWRALGVVSGLAAAGRVLGDYDTDLAERSLTAATEIFEEYTNPEESLYGPGISAASELYLSTGDQKYLDHLLTSRQAVLESADQTGWSVSRVVSEIGDEDFQAQFRDSLTVYAKTVTEAMSKNPYNVPYDPAIWGAGWTIEEHAVKQFYLFDNFPELFPKENFINPLQYVLGVHQGENTMSYVSGVGYDSPTTAYGTNRADWSYIPGGVISGTGLIRPNFPELKHWPFFWQQTEYVIGGAATNFMFLSLAADDVLNN
ncbi:glycoside hydrolase family 9 protein [Gracilimonas mengyeensis]|uniref:N-terminal ig-like domain of cellulase n=1 Tax=Gracilimonas mengyeensis TaxID=1302730 RepID=A0A521AXX5_9BACT|nr:glycoside hydrolase family 9 protein [Gracilimonas mengyeensis]SMO39688.1 N-terminal ig-like domain of cellulase [Gracilimonas mengyeensis]